LLGRSFIELQNVKPGFTAESALSLRVSLPQRSYADSNAQHAFYTRVVEGLGALPEVTSVGGHVLPCRWPGSARRRRSGAPTRLSHHQPIVRLRTRARSTVGYFKAMNIPMLAGRDVARAIRPTSLPSR
jgi:hypothetical protein